MMTPGTLQQKSIIHDRIMPDAWHDAIDVLPRESHPAHQLETEEGKPYERALNI